MRNAKLLAGLTALWLGTAAAWAQDKPQYGGALEIVTIYPTISALSWDLADWNWKHNHDTGQVYEQLFAADLTKSVKNGGPHPFYADAWLPSDAIRGELAESWEWKENPLRVEIKLRKGVMFPEKPGVMASRELVADEELLEILAGVVIELPVPVIRIERQRGQRDVDRADLERAAVFRLVGVRPQRTDAQHQRQSEDAGSQPGGDATLPQRFLLFRIVLTRTSTRSAHARIEEIA